MAADGIRRLSPDGGNGPAPSNQGIDRGVLTISNLAVRYSTRTSGEMVAVQDFNLSTRPGEFVCIVGPSGCGKTSVLRVVAGLLTPKTGTVMLNGENVTGPSRARCMVFQDYALFPWYSTLDNVAYGLRIMGVSKRERRRRAQEWLDRVGLGKYAHHYPAELSGGMRQRVAIVRALAVDPEVLLMDEPFGALDAQTRNELQLALLEIWSFSHKTTLFVTHSIEEAVYLADHIVIMASNPGRTIAEMNISLERPRDKRSEEFNHIEARIAESLRPT